MNATRIVLVVSLVLALSLGVTTLVSASRARDLAARLEQTEADFQKLKTSKPNNPSATENDRLRRLLEDRELAYAQLHDELAQLNREAQPTPARSADAPRTTSGNPRSTGQDRGGQSWLDRIRQVDPERYKQLIEQREQRRKQTDQWYADQIAQLDERAQSSPSQREAELANQIADTLAKLNDLRQQWQAIRNLPDDERRVQSEQLRAETGDAFRTLNELRDRDRQTQLANLGRSVGYNDPNTVQGFVDSVTDIYKNTEYNPGPGFGGGGRGGWGGPGGPPSPPQSQPSR